MPHRDDLGIVPSSVGGMNRGHQPLRPTIQGGSLFHGVGRSIVDACHSGSVTADVVHDGLDHMRLAPGN